MQMTGVGILKSCSKPAVGSFFHEFRYLAIFNMA